MGAGSVKWNEETWTYLGINDLHSLMDLVDSARVGDDLREKRWGLEVAMWICFEQAEDRLRQSRKQETTCKIQRDTRRYTSWVVEKYRARG